MLGPVMMAHRSSPSSMWVSLGTNTAFFSIFSTTGCRPSVMLRTEELSTRGIQYWLAAATTAKEVSTSTWATAAAAAWIWATWAQTSSRSSTNSWYSRATTLSWAERMVCSSSFSSWEIYRSALTVVCLRTQSWGTRSVWDLATSM